jgi:hypothetical protein
LFNAAVNACNSTRTSAIPRRPEELLLGQNARLQELPDQSRHLPISYALAQPVQEKMMIDLIETALDVPLNNPDVWRSVSPPVLPAFRQRMSLEDCIEPVPSEHALAIPSRQPFPPHHHDEINDTEIVRHLDAPGAAAQVHTTPRGLGRTRRPRENVQQRAVKFGAVQQN